MTDMHHRTELPFVDEFQWVSPLHSIKNKWHNAVALWCMLEVGPPSLHYCCAVVLHSSIILPPACHSSNHEYHCCQLTGQSSGVSNFYHTFKVFIWLTFISITLLDIAQKCLPIILHVNNWQLILIFMKDTWCVFCLLTFVLMFILC